MPIKARAGNTEDMPPTSAAQKSRHRKTNPDSDLGLGLQLGNDYEIKKKKLQQELQMEYKQYAAKKKDLKVSELHPQLHGLSLPIYEKTSVQERLREERNKEYNLFLQEKAKTGRLKRAISPATSKPGQFQASDMVCISPPASPPPILNTHMYTGLSSRERPASRRDAITLTEIVDNERNRRTLGPGRHGQRRREIRRPKEPYSSEDEFFTDREDELEFRHWRRQHRYTPEPEYKDQRRTRRHRSNRTAPDMLEVEPPGVYDQNNNEWVPRSDLQMPDSMRTAARSRLATSKDKATFATGLMIGATDDQMASKMRKERYKQELLTQIAEKQKKQMREKKLELRIAAIGATDPEKQPHQIKQFGAVNRQYGSLRRDVPYKPGVDLGAEHKDSYPRPKEDKPTWDTKAGKSHVDYGPALSQLTGKTADYFNEDYHRDFSNILGEVANPRVAGVPLPAPPTVTNNYNTPYDAAYYYYGARNPFDPNLPHNQNDLPGRLQQPGNYHSPPQRPPPLRPSSRIEASDQHRASPLDIGGFPAEKSKQRRESALGYQEALKQQIKESEERKRRAKEEKERYDAKLEAEMMTYNPWGRSGGGAPNKDQKGNLVSDLKQMHKTNEESYRNHTPHTPGVEAGASLSHRQSGFSDQPAPWQLDAQDQYKADLKRQIEADKQKRAEELVRAKLAEDKEERKLADDRARMKREYEKEQSKEKPIKQERSVSAPHSQPVPAKIPQQQGFSDQPQQLQTQDQLKADLKRQMEENKQRQAEKIEQARLLDEINERRYAEQTARMQREYEKARTKEQEIDSTQHRLEKQKLIAEPKTRQQEEEKREVKRDEEIEKKVPESAGDGEEKRAQLSYEREPSPPIPTLQSKQTHLLESRPSSVVSQLPAKTERSLSAPHSQPVPAKIPQLQDGRQEVLRELSNLHKYLKKEQRQLEAQLGQTERQESHYTPPNRPRGRRRVDAFESTHKPTISPSSDTERNMQNIREFNQLKYKDTASREEVRHVFPDPPTDAQNLDIQQQALLREQQRKIRLMKREEKEENDFLYQKLRHCRPRNKPAPYLHKDSILPSEFFTDFHSGDASKEQERRRQPSAERRERTAPRRRRDYDEVPMPMDQRDRSMQPDAQSAQSETSLNLESKVRTHNQHRHMRHDSGDHNGRSEGPSGDETVVPSLRSALERCSSTDTVATEAWLRPGTSDSVKRSGYRERLNAVIKKAQQCLHFLRVFRKNNLDKKLLLAFYRSSIESLLT